MKTPSLQETLKKIQATSTKEEALKKTYNILTKKYHGGRLSSWLKFLDLFKNDPKKIWQRSGFLHCINANKILREILTKSGKFKKNEIKTKWTLLWYISPHQYLKVKVEKNKWINIDLWAKKYGVTFGDYAHGFHTKTLDKIK